MRCIKYIENNKIFKPGASPYYVQMQFFFCESMLWIFFPGSVAFLYL